MRDHVIRWIASFLEEMRRRKVWRVAVAYVIGAVALMEGAEVAVGALSLSPRILTWLVIGVMVGFPAAMAAAWVFDLTPRGVKRTPDADPSGGYRSGVSLVVLVVLSLGVAVTSGWYLARLDTPWEDLDGLVVLPLANLTGDPLGDYFVDGLHDALIAELSRLPGIKIISRTSATHYRGTTKSLQEIGNELAVEAVVEGSVLRNGERVTVIVKLLAVDPERNLWTGEFERTMDEVSDLQRELAHRIAREVRVSLRPGDEARFTTADNVDPRAYDDFLRARALWRSQVEEDVEESITLFNRAITVEPEYAEAYAGLALSYISLSWIGTEPLPPRSVFPRARAAAIRALQLDSTVADAHAVMGLVDWRYYLDASAAEAAFLRALELEPNNAGVFHWYALFLATRERWRESETMISKALELDPLSLLITANRGWIHYFAGDASSALADADATLHLWPASGLPYYHRGLALVQLGRLDEAIRSFRVAIGRSGSLPYLLASLGNALASAGNAGEAREILENLLTRDYVAPYLMAIVELGLGQEAAALEWLEAAFQVQDAYLPFLAVDPIWKPLHSDPRFVRILHQAGHRPS
jgi:TolB-like protein